MAKVMISLPDGLLRQLDDEAQRRGTTRSGLLRDYIDAGLRQRDVERARKIREILAEPVEPGGFGGNSVEFIKQERQLRLDKLSRRGT